MRIGQSDSHSASGAAAFSYAGGSGAGSGVASATSAITSPNQTCGWLNVCWTLTGYLPQITRMDHEDDD